MQGQRVTYNPGRNIQSFQKYCSVLASGQPQTSFYRFQVEDVNATLYRHTVFIPLLFWGPQWSLMWCFPTTGSWYEGRAPDNSLWSVGNSLSSLAVNELMKGAMQVNIRQQQSPLMVQFCTGPCFPTIFLLYLISIEHIGHVRVPSFCFFWLLPPRCSSSLFTIRIHILLSPTVEAPCFL